MYAATLVVDASWCPDTGAAGYGYWIASDRGKLGGGAPLSGVLASSNLAEMRAICSSLFIIQEIKFLLSGERILIQTDSQAAIFAFTKQRDVETTDEKHAVKVFRKLAKGIEINFRHVKAHTSRAGARFIANNYCDKNAKRSMVIARKELLRERTISNV